MDSWWISNFGSFWNMAAIIWHDVDGAGVIQTHEIKSLIVLLIALYTGIFRLYG